MSTSTNLWLTFQNRIVSLLSNNLLETPMLQCLQQETFCSPKHFTLYPTLYLIVKKKHLKMFDIFTLTIWNTVCMLEERVSPVATGSHRVTEAQRGDKD